MMVIFRGYLFCNVGSFWWSINSFQITYNFWGVPQSVQKSSEFWSMNLIMHVTFMCPRLLVSVLNLTKCDKMWQNVAKCDKMWQNLAKCDKIWQNLAKCDKMWQKLAKCDKMYQNVTQCDKIGEIWQHLAKCDEMCQNVTGFTGSSMWAALILSAPLPLLDKIVHLDQEIRSSSSSSSSLGSGRLGQGGSSG